VRRAAVIVFVTMLGLALAGCGPCGFSFGTWDAAQSCRGEPNPAR